jgi:transposase InsO family protein
VKFLKFVDPAGRKVQRYQFTAVDDATRIRALKVYDRHNQESAIDFIDDVVARFPFRIHTVRTDNGHEFQAKFHWHVEDQGMRHTYIKPRSPNLNGKVERSPPTDELEFYQLLEHTDDVDLAHKLAVWEEFYNVHRPHAGLSGQTPNKTFSSWAEIFGDPIAVAALVDRLVHHAEVLVLRGESHRLQGKGKELLQGDGRT